VAKVPAGVGPQFPQVVVLVGATDDLSRRKLLPGLFHLVSSGFIPGCRIIGVSLDDIDAEAFRAIVHKALVDHPTRKLTDTDWAGFAPCLDYVSLGAGAQALQEAVLRAEQTFSGHSQRLHYLSVPPAAALPAVHLLRDAGLVERSRIIMEKPFGTDLASPVALNAKLHEAFERLILDAMRGATRCSRPRLASSGCGRSRRPCSPTRRRCALTTRAPGGPTRSTASWHPIPGGCRSSAPGASRTRWEAEPGPIGYARPDRSGSAT
jgi:glucose-6-phosphate 1-dehydrogenase